MILSGRLGINDRVDRAATSSMVTARIREVDARRRAAELTLDALRDAWHTSPAVQCETDWREVDEAARDAIDALSALLGALDLAREQIHRSVAPAPPSSVAARAAASVIVPRQTDRRARPWDATGADLRPSGEVSARPASRPETW